MKIATYNIWNDDRGWPERLNQIYKEINAQNSDIICLQDVPDEDYCRLLMEKCNYGYSYFTKGISCELAVLSRLPFIIKENYSEGQIVKNFLFGNQSLYGEEVAPVWNDLAIEYEMHTGVKPKATLDLATNPRWKDNGYKECAGNRIDWILMKETYPKPTPELLKTGIFGTEVSRETGYCASDHYGVYAVLDFENIVSTL